MFDLFIVNEMVCTGRIFLAPTLNVHVSTGREKGGGGTKFPEATVFNEVMTTI